MSPRTAEANRLVREETRSRIVRHALALFGEHGFERTSVRMIADAAGVATGLLYSYFPSKEALLQAIFAARVADVQRIFAQAGSAADPRARLEHIIRDTFDLLGQDLDFWRLAHGMREQAAVKEKLGAEAPAWRTALRRSLERHYRAAGVADPHVEAVLLLSMIDGAAHHYALEPERYPLAEVTEAIVARFVPRPARARR
jgi:AcrR family transcriptional regulator